MCQKLSDLKSAVSGYATRFDPSVITTEQAAEAVELAAAMEASVRTIKALAASRASDSDAWKKNGHRSFAESLAKGTGVSLSRAKEELETARRLASQPQIEAAARRGEISFEKVELIADAVEADPRAQRRLLHEARHMGVSELKGECASTKAKASSDFEEHERKIHQRRSLRSWTDVEGVWHLKASGTPRDGVEVMSAIDKIRSVIFNRTSARKDDEPVTSGEALSFDALVELAKVSFSKDAATSAGPAIGGVPMKLIVRVDYDAFLRGFPVDEERCEIAGFGPLSVGGLKKLLNEKDPLVACVLMRAKEVAGVAHLGRKPTAHQRTALEWLYPTCAVDGCGSMVHLEMDHTIDWAETHFTMLDHLEFLCSHHHRLKSTGEFRLLHKSTGCVLVPRQMDTRKPPTTRHRQPSRGAARNRRMRT